MSKEALEILEAVEWALNGACYICKGLEPRHFSNCALKQAIILLKQQPPAGDYPNSEFTKVQRLAIESCEASYKGDEWLPIGLQRLAEACDRLDRAESINADLLAACEAVSKSVGDFRPDGETMILIEAAITKAVGE